MNNHDLFTLWMKTGVITRMNKTPRELNVGDAFGIVIFVAALAFAWGYYLGN